MASPPTRRDGPADVELRDRRLDQLRALSRLLDTAFTVPGTRFRVGLDPIIGLIPGLGDTIGAAMSGWIVLQAARLGAPKSVLLRMAANVGIEALVGAVPLLGDLFDAAFKANARNMVLLEGHFTRPVETRRASRGFVALLLLAIALLVIGAVALAVAIFRIGGQVLANF